MYVELACLNEMATSEDTQKIVFAATSSNLNGVAVLPAYVAAMKQYTPDMVLSTPVDYPHGTQNTKIREHAVLSAIRRGANSIDLVMNNSLVVNKKMEKLLVDVEVCFAVCRQHNATMRAMLEYRVYEDAGLFFDVIALLEAVGVEYVFPSTGHRLDNFHDNLITARTIMERSDKLKVISNGGIYTKEQYQIAKDSEVYGIRITSIPVTKLLFGV